MTVNTFLGVYPLETSAKFLTTAGFIFHVLDIICISVGDFNTIFDMSKDPNFHSDYPIGVVMALVNAIIAVFLTYHVLCLVMYYMLYKATITRNYLLMVPAMLHIGTIAISSVFFSFLSIFDILYEGMEFIFFASLFVTIPTVYLYICLQSLCFKLYNEHQLRGNQVDPKDSAINAGFQQMSNIYHRV